MVISNFWIKSPTFNPPVITYIIYCITLKCLVCVSLTHIPPMFQYVSELNAFYLYPSMHLHMYLVVTSYTWYKIIPMQSQL